MKLPPLSSGAVYMLAIQRSVGMVLKYLEKFYVIFCRLMNLHNKVFVA